MVDLSSILALPPTSASVPSLLSLLRGGDPQNRGGGGGGFGPMSAPVQGQGQQQEQQGRGSGEAGQLQMAQSAMDGGGSTRPDGSSWQPERWKAVPWREPGSGSYDSTLPDYYNPAAWGPPPAYVEGGYSGFFPGVFGKSDPNGKYWTMKDYMAQAPKKQGVVYDEDDYSPNTINPNLISNPASRAVRGLPNAPEPGFMYKQGSFSRRQIGEDLQQGQNPGSAEGGVNRPPIRSTTRYGSPMAAFDYGALAMLGLPGLLGQWTTSY